MNQKKKEMINLIVHQVMNETRMNLKSKSNSKTRMAEKMKNIVDREVNKYYKEVVANNEV